MSILMKIELNSEVRMSINQRRMALYGAVTEDEEATRMIVVADRR